MNLKDNMLSEKANTKGCKLWFHFYYILEIKIIEMENRFVFDKVRDDEAGGRVGTIKG